MNYATPTLDVMLFTQAEVMVASPEKEKGETDFLPFAFNREELTVRDIEDI